MNRLRFIPIIAALLVALPGLTGCGGKKQKQQMQLQRAYTAGRMEALQQVQQSQGPSISIVGPVERPIVPWTGGLTLAQAILQAGYFPKNDPLTILIIRNNQPIPFDPRRLLRGEDMPVEPGDLIEIRP